MRERDLRMQMNRCFEIVYLLLERKKDDGSELADRFEVSVRTIYRDLDFLSQAGILIYARRGKTAVMNCGIRLF